MSKNRHKTWLMTSLAVMLLSSARAEPAGPGMDHAHMNDDPLVWMVLVDQLEWQKSSSADAVAWDLAAWAGYDTGRLRLRAEGTRANGATVDNRAELLWSRPVAPWWDLVAGLRQDSGLGPARTYGVIGVQGLSPYRFQVEADLFVGERGQAGARVKSEYNVLLTNRLMLGPRAELQGFVKDDSATGVGSGLSTLELGLRLRYEIRREFAPYVGVEWTGKLGDTADLARESADLVRDTKFVAGLRLWF